MIGLSVQTEDNTKRVADAAEKATFRNVGHAAAAIRNDAIESILPSDEPSAPGSPPHTRSAGIGKNGKVRRGVLQKAIVFHQDFAAQMAIVGPRFSVAGESGEAHEFGGEFRGQDYPERSFMGTALDRKRARFASSFEGSIGE
jgi:hypothetical protein